MLLSISLILILGRFMGMDMPENQIAEFTWHADYRYCSGTICA